MKQPCKIVLAAMVMALFPAGAAIAQTDGAGGAVPKPSKNIPIQPPTPKKNAGAAQPAAQTSQGAPEAGKLQNSVVGNFGEWVLVCANEKDDQGKIPCSLVQALVEQKSQKPVFRVIFTHGPKGNLVLQIDGPVGVALQRGLEFSPDTKKVYRLPYQTCIPRGCRAVMVVEDDLKGELQASKKGTLTVFALNGQAVRTPTDLTGLADGLLALDQRRTPATKAKKQ
jgi:invasion protein IalB